MILLCLKILLIRMMRMNVMQLKVPTVNFGKTSITAEDGVITVRSSVHAL